MQVKPATSDPASGSEIAKQILFSPAKTSLVTLSYTYF